jgi:hypothetical protein
MISDMPFIFNSNVMYVLNDPLETVKFFHFSICYFIVFYYIRLERFEVIMKIDIADPGIHVIGELLSSGGYQSRLVGGAVRDMLMGMKPKDMDLATDALPEIVMELASRQGYRVIPTGLQHGTVTIVYDDIGYEVTTLRKDVDTDGRHATVEYVTDFAEDAARRDFTINAMSASVDGEVYDYFGGLKDLSAYPALLSFSSSVWRRRDRTRSEGDQR